MADARRPSSSGRPTSSGRSTTSASRQSRSRQTGHAADRDRRLTSDDWVEAGQALLRERGISSVKLPNLTRRLGVSTGSFYHHFEDFAQYRAELADRYTVDLIQRDLDSARQGEDADPIDRLHRLGRRSLDAGTFALDAAMRIWATMDQRALAAVQRADALVESFIAEAFVDLGFEPEAAQLRARVLLSANVAPLVHDTDEARAEFFVRCLRLLSEGSPRGG